MDRKDNHHLIPKARGGPRKKWNLVRLWRKKHDAWHRLFGIMTLEETIEFLKNLHEYKPQTKYWGQLFKNKSVRGAVELLCRLKAFKKSQKNAYDKKYAYKNYRVYVLTKAA